MPRVSGYQEAHLLYTPKSRRSSFPEAQLPFILHASMNIARAFATVHDAGQVIGDVNHSNLLISKEAMVALIDCDSFEISDGLSCFPCLVGVPTYTPPELQGRSFQGVRRTQQHDAFGLAVLLFHLLSLGRHPFAGIFRHGTADKAIEDAIREFRFAYLPVNRLTEMEPPPLIPVLAEFPAEIGQLFVRAFNREGASGRRPAANEWIAPLESLSRNLKRCAANDTHHYFQALVSCPWCRVENAFGRPMFGVKITIISGPDFDLVAVWAQIESVRPDEPSVTPRFTNAYIDQCIPEPRIPEIKKERGKKRLFGVGSILLAVILVVPAPIAPAPGHRHSRDRYRSHG
jgi:DNA-binding helix-hairpin-helix protein with protein kinase domain